MRHALNSLHGAWLLLGLVGCGGNAAPPDAAMPMAYRLYLEPSEPQDRPVPTVAPIAYIDGIATRDLEIMYSSEHDAIGATHVVELRYDSEVVATKTLTIDLSGCLFSLVPVATRYMQTLCTYDSGDLRFASDEASGATGVCTGDGFCLPECFPTAMMDGCTSGQHCTALVTSTSPFASHVGCAPIGSKQLADACALTASPGGAYDDCAEGLVCINGTCRQSCWPEGPTCATCSYVAGYPPELGACL